MSLPVVTCCWVSYKEMWRTDQTCSVCRFILYHLCNLWFKFPSNGWNTEVWMVFDFGRHVVTPPSACCPSPLEKVECGKLIQNQQIISFKWTLSSIRTLITVKMILLLDQKPGLGPTFLSLLSVWCFCLCFEKEPKQRGRRENRTEHNRIKQNRMK